MTVNRLTQISVEVLISESKNRVTQISAETVRSANNLFNNARLTQISAEVVAKLNLNAILQVTLEIIENINPINNDPLKLCLPFDETLTKSFTQDQSPSIHPIDMTSGGLPTIDASPSKFGGGAVNVATTDYARVLLPQPDFNFIDDFTIEFWVFRNDTGGIEDIMGQWPTTDKGWRIRFNLSNLEFEWTSDGSTVNTEVIPFSIPISTWTHLAFENFGVIFTVYIDGFAIFNVASITPIHVSNGDLFIGKVESTGVAEEFDGSIDEFKMVVGQATFQTPFLTPVGSIDCSSVIPPDISWNPGNLGEQDECESSEFQIIVTGLEAVIGIQSFTTTGLPPGMVIDSNGNIFGTLPIHTAPPSIMNYEFQVTFFVGGVALLGPDTFSFDVKDIFIGDILQITVPTLFEDADRTAWKLHLVTLIPNEDQFLPAGDDFGITLTPRLFLMDGLIEDDIAAFQTAVASFDSTTGGLPDRNEIVIETLKFGTNGRFDVLYYSVNDTASTVNSFANPLGISPDPIEPRSLDNIRDKLIAGVGFAARSDSSTPRELLPDWLPVFEPLIIAGFVQAGKGQAIVDTFDGDAVHHVFKGRTVIIDRLDIRRCSTQWVENGETRLTIKFDDI